MTRRRTQAFLAGLGLLALAGCAAESNPAWQLAGEPGLLLKVKHYYQRHAIEEGGSCPAPLLEGITRSRIIEDDPERLVVDVGYYYRDFVMDDEDCGEGRPLRCGILSQCRGFGQRTFTIDRTPGGLEVVDMSGHRRGARAAAP